MAVVDLVCTYDSATSAAWTNGSNISTNNGTNAEISGITTGQLVNLGFTTDAASVIPPGSVITSVQLILKYHSLYYCNNYAYVKTPGGFPDGGSASHTLQFLGSSSTLLTSINIGVERPAVYSDPLTSGQIRLFHDDSSGFPNTLYVDYLSLRVTYTEGSAFPQMFLMEAF